MQLLKLLQVIVMAAFEICGLALFVLAVRFFLWRDKRDEDFAELVERWREEQSRRERTAQEQSRKEQSRRERTMQKQPSKHMRAAQQPSQNVQRQDEWAALNRLRDEIERRERQANQRAAEPILKNGVYRQKRALFGPWPLLLHQNDEQYARYVRSRCQQIQLKLEDDHPYTIIGTSGEYKTSLRSCTCMDFRKNQQGLAPCKYMYFLARQCGYDVVRKTLGDKESSLSTDVGRLLLFTRTKAECVDRICGHIAVYTRCRRSHECSMQRKQHCGQP